MNHAMFHDIMTNVIVCMCVLLQVVSRSKEFVAEVMGDDTLQREGGDALFKSVYHALTPGLYRY